MTFTRGSGVFDQFDSDEYHHERISRVGDYIAIVLTIFSILTIYSVCRWQYHVILQGHVAFALEDGQKVLQALKDHTSKLLQNGDEYLLSIRFRYQCGKSKGAISEYLKESQTTSTRIFQKSLLIGCADGKIDYYTGIKNNSISSIDGLGYYNYFKNNPTDTLYIDPTRLGYISGQYLFRLARPILRNGQFGGVVMTSISPAYFSELFRNYHLGDHSVAAIVSNNHYLLARYPEAPDQLFGKPIHDIRLWQYLAKSSSGMYVTRSMVDGLQRHILYARLTDYPLIITLGISEHDIEDRLQHVRNMLIVVFCIFSIIAFSVCALSLILLRRNRRLAEAEKVIRSLANTDSLTGAANRRSFIALAEREFDRARQYNLPLVVMMLDADRFKSINDTFGHFIGDTVLQQLAHITMSNLRNTDAFGRLGGEEFAILLPQITLDGAVIWAEKIRSIIENTVVHSDKGDVHFTVSIGVCIYVYGIDSIHAMLHRADEALYQAKKGGRNKTVVAP